MAKVIYTNGRAVGAVERGVFRKSIRHNHYLRQPPAIALSNESLDAARRAGAHIVQVTDRDADVTWTARLDFIESHGFAVQRGGFEPQIALPLAQWSKTTSAGDGAPVQPSLFD